MDESGETTAATQPGEPVRTGPRRRPRALSRRAWTLILSAFVVVVLGVVGAVVPVPYVALGPGPTFDTLSSVNGKQVVTVNGTRTYPTDGQLRMVTVSLTNGTTLFSALGMWMSGRYALAPREDYFQPGESEQQVERQNVQEFKNSQSDAEVSALRYLHYPINAVAQEVVSHTPADGRIKPGDKLLRVNGKAVTSAEAVQSALADTRPGQTVHVIVQTGDQAPRDLRITLGKNPDPSRKQGFLGITPGAHANVPFRVTISLSNIGGPSAGLIFALAVVDKLTPGKLNGGLKVAGTGEIDDLGDVGPIGGIPFKLVAARNAGANVFLVPADNCSEARTRVPDGLRLVKVTDLHSAISELKALQAGRPVPGC